MSTSFAILFSAALATIGWMYSARKQRQLTKKQHTVSVMLQANMSAEFSRGEIIAIFETSSEYIAATRSARNRQAIYEHLEWLYDRWEVKYPPWYQRIWEKRIMGRPLAGKRINPVDLQKRINHKR